MFGVRGINEKKKNSYSDMMGKSDGKDHLEDLGVDAKNI
jgi:hypothetical protein